MNGTNPEIPSILNELENSRRELANVGTIKRWLRSAAYREAKARVIRAIELGKMALNSSPANAVEITLLQTAIKLAEDELNR